MSRARSFLVFKTRTIVATSHAAQFLASSCVRTRTKLQTFHRICSSDTVSELQICKACLSLARTRSSISALGALERPALARGGLVHGPTAAAAAAAAAAGSLAYARR